MNEELLKLLREACFLIGETETDKDQVIKNLDFLDKVDAFQKPKLVNY